MKNYYLLVLSLATLTACSGGSNNQQNDEVPHQSAVVDTFYSADRAFADVRGPVSQCVIVSRDMVQSGDTMSLDEESILTTKTLKFDAAGHIASVVEEDVYMDQPVGKSVFTFEFDTDGKLTSSSTDIDGRFVVKRNPKGQVTTFTSIGPGGDVDYTKVYSYNGHLLQTEQITPDRPVASDDENPVIVPTYKVSYTYDDNGYLLSSNEESGDRELHMTSTVTTYKYKNHDEHGNWTERDVERVAKVYNMRPRRTLTDSIATFQRETRTIKY